MLCSHAAAESIRPPLPSDITLNKDAGRGSYLFVTVRLESGEKLPFIVDTGSPITLFAKSLEPKLGKRLGTVGIWSPGIGTRKGGIFTTPKLYLGSTPLVTGTHVFTSGMTLQTLFTRRRVRGILGIDCLLHYCIQVDFAAGKMRFLNPEQLDVAQLGKAFPIKLSDRRDNVLPFIHHAGLSGGTGTNLLIDTGCHLDGFVENGAIKSHGLGRMLSLFGRGRSMPKCIWGGAKYTKIHVRVTGSQNTLGLRFLARHLVTLDFPNRTMYLKQTSAGPLPTAPQAGKSTHAIKPGSVNDT
jgi:hypothetical protein